MARRRRQSFTTGRRYSSVVVFTHTVLTICWFSGSVVRAGSRRLTVPVSQVPRGAFLSMIKTKSPTWTLRGFRVHFLLSVKAGTYSTIHRRQNLATSSYACLHLLCDSVPSSSKQSGGMCGWARPSRKWLGVSGLSSSGSTLKCVSGRAFRMAVTSAKTVRSTSSFTVMHPSTP